MSRAVTGVQERAHTKTPRDLRDWLDHLSATGALAVARPGVDLKFELAAIAKRLDGEQATYFPQPSGHSGAVVSGLTSSRDWMAQAMDVAASELLKRFQAAVATPLPHHEIKNAPAQEIVNRKADGASIDLAALMPIPTHNALDSGPYIAAGLLIARNPSNGAQNVSIHRLQVSGPDRLGALLLPRHTLAYQQGAEERGEDLPIAIAIGVDPLTLLASQAIVPLDCDELGIAGALHGRPLDVVKCVTNDVRVPAHAEFIIEGRLLARTREPEGPFGEFPQYYGDRAERHVIAIDAVTHRRYPIFHTIIGGGLEHLLLGGIPREASMLLHLQRSFPNVLDVHLARGGVCRYHLYVKMRPRSHGEAKNVIMGAFAGHYDIKQVIVVDEDVDIHKPSEVEWAVATRFQADRDLVVIAGAQGSKLDPSAADGFGAKMGLDATKPIDAPALRYQRIHVPGEDKVDLAASIDAAASWRDTVQPKQAGASTKDRAKTAIAKTAAKQDA